MTPLFLAKVPKNANTNPTLAAEYLDRMLAGIGPVQPPFCEEEVSSGIFAPWPFVNQKPRNQLVSPLQMRGRF